MARRPQLLLLTVGLFVGIGIVVVVHRPVSAGDLLVAAIAYVIAWLLIAAGIVMRTDSRSPLDRR